MWKSIILIFALSKVGNSEYPQPEGPCQSAFGTEGTCLVLNECDEIFSILKESSRAFLPAIHDILKESHCGFDGFRPKICCPLSSPTSSSTPKVTERPIEQNTIPGLTSENNSLLPPDVTRHPNLNQLPVNCGDDDSDKITAGERTSIMEYPWMALIAHSSKNGLSFGCGGSIINSRFILTAAHCVTDLRNLILAGVRVGEHSLDTEEDCEGPDYDKLCASPPQDFLIESVFIHPQYNVPRLQNDIALIKLGPIDFSKNNVIPICLPVSEELRNLKLEGLSVKIAGWGITENKTSSNVLLQARVPVMTNPQCAEAYKSLLPVGTTIGYKQICAGGATGSDSCKGDSGGPMMFPSNVNNVIKIVQHGIVSYGYTACGTIGIPGVYTRVAYYMDWILDQLKN
ncbi:CLIP domain-containing serine protease HP8-like isoform X2 [Arctopsyche grandis]|uniref:CLIP domain-containing serine protease HP8-like isoform X2 n=1 Tax=Arctopsyche grandis TaxID=121162 RepID=UPI00406D7794